MTIAVDMISWNFDLKRIMFKKPEVSLEDYIS